MYSNSRSHRAETRNRAKDELKRAIYSVDRVRKWERRWILLKDTSMRIYKWVPVTAHANIPVAPKPKLVEGDQSNTIASADDVSQDSSSARAVSAFVGNQEDSNTGFSDRGFDSDSNQASLLIFMTAEAPVYNRTGNATNPSTDFSAMREAEMKK